MKKVKILLGISMVAALLVAMVAFSASAASMTLDVALSAEAVEVGDPVNATVSVENSADGLASFTVQILYDASALKLEKATAVDYDGVIESVYTEDGKVNVNFLVENIEAELPAISEVATLEFTALVAGEDAGITAKFPANTMMNSEAAKGEDAPTYVQPEDGIYDDAVVPAPKVDIVEEGALEPGEPDEPGEPGVSGAGSTSLTANGSVSLEVLAAYDSGTKVDNYRVDIAWENLAFAYTSTSETWDPDNYKYVSSETGTWDVKTIEEAVTVANHSSQGITINAAAASIIDGVELALTDGAASLGDAINGATSTSFTLTADGTLPKDHNGKIGTVTVTIGGIPDDYEPVEVPGATE